jgi:hypothetical protein
MALLAEDEPTRWLAAVVYVFAAGVLTAPMVLLGLALGSMGA